MKTDERRRLMLLLGLLVAAMVVLLVRYLPRGAENGAAASDADIQFKVRRVPVLAMNVLTPVPQTAGNIGRNPFTYGPRPTPTPAPPRPTRPPQKYRPRPTPTPRMITTKDGRSLPPPPPFRAKFIGYFGPPERMVAVFRDHERVKVQVEGGVLDDTFIVRHVGYQSVVIGYVGYPEEVTTRVPLEK